MSYKDNFSVQADLYAQYRPHYPTELYDYLYGLVTNFNVAWDCATGNGQVASKLALKFKKVYASDISQKQLDNAWKADNIEYLIAPAEQTSLKSNSVDLITVAQALHWFNFPAFYEEVQRVAKPETILAYWGYNLPDINKEINALTRHFHDEVVGSYWDPERKILLDEYADIHFPLKAIKRRDFSYTAQWSIDHIIGYLSSWSSVQQYIKLNNKNPLEEIVDKLKTEWGDKQTISFPIFLTLGRVQ